MRGQVMRCFFAGLFLFFTFTVPAHARPEAVTQLATIDALLAGAYDGQWPCSLLAEHGDLGIGTFHRLDGEMIVLDGVVYQVKEGVNVPGYHLHFLSEDRGSGGHVLDFRLEGGRAGIGLYRRFLTVLPGEGSGFGSLDLERDRAKALEAVEQTGSAGKGAGP
ncbi:MAG: acetolactate decarboxylase [Deltaproteobacteria bacterium]|nr:acetolactate decarboxylase [Deltaproteobacteria bacterium]